MSETLKNRIIFEPGNLIHGAPIKDLPRILREGLRPAVAVWGDDEGTDTSDEICFGMIPDFTNPAERYENTNHRGPRANSSLLSYDDMFSVVVSRRALIERYGSHLSAVGYHFWDKKFRNIAKDLYDIDFEERKVNGIQIKPHKMHSGYPDQVRLYAYDLNTTRVDQPVWCELVIKEHQVDRVSSLARDAREEIYAPIYTPTGERLVLRTNKLFTGASFESGERKLAMAG